MKRRREARDVDWALSRPQAAMADAMWRALLGVATEPGAAPVALKALLDGHEVVVLGAAMGPVLAGYRSIARLVIVIDSDLGARLQTEGTERP